MCLKKEKLYEIIAEEHRYASEFRAKIIAGWFAIYTALAFAFPWFQEKAKEISFIVPLFGLFLTVLMWMADNRNRKALNSSRELGAKIEKDKKDPFPSEFRYFSSLTDGVPHGKLITIFSIVMLHLLGITTIILIIIGGDLNKIL
jgi:hypothetical protein